MGNVNLDWIFDHIKELVFILLGGHNVIMVVLFKESLGLGGPVVKTPSFQCKRGAGSILGQGTKIPHDVRCSQKKKELLPLRLNITPFFSMTKKQLLLYIAVFLSSTPK